MTSDRIKEIQATTGLPNSASVSVMLALKQVWNECEQEQNERLKVEREWISVETPPKDGSDVWIFEDGKVMLAYYWDYCDRLVYMNGDQEHKPTQWMYLITPQPPKQ